jgi:hypothetical protein
MAVEIGFDDPRSEEMRALRRPLIGCRYRVESLARWANATRRCELERQRRVNVADASPAHTEIASRIERDLRLRFPGASVQWIRDEDGALSVTVVSGDENWGEVATSWWDDDHWSPAELENLLVAVAASIADNLWPDEATDPWPPGSAHPDHPLSIGLVGGLACWYCKRDRSIAHPIGQLESSA